MTMLDIMRRDPSRVIFIDGIDHLITGGEAYLTRSGQSVAVTLYGPRDPRDPDAYPVSRHRVYLPLEWVAPATEPRHLLNAATHKARRWLDDCKADYWHALLVIACRPMRARCRPLLTAIAKCARARWGDKYWRHAEAREMLAREVGLMGIKPPPPVSVLHWLPLMPQEAAA